MKKKQQQYYTANAGVVASAGSGGPSAIANANSSQISLIPNNMSGSTGQGGFNHPSSATSNIIVT
jgi:hypothetical protein